MDGIRILTAGAGTTVLAAPPNDPYYYACHRMKDSESFIMPDFLNMVSVFVANVPDHLSPHHSANISMTNSEITLLPGDSWHGENYLPTEWCAHGDAVVLVAGVKTLITKINSKITRAGEYYRVNKPWGHELWLNGENTVFVFKEVHIKQSHQTSLQYHHFKEETSLLLVGETTLVYKQAADVANDDVTATNLAEKLLPPGSAVEVKPPALHRLRAVTDIYSYEVTTPHNDDIIRVFDDSNRPNGRIQAEHRA